MFIPLAPPLSLSPSSGGDPIGDTCDLLPSISDPTRELRPQETFLSGKKKERKGERESENLVSAAVLFSPCSL